MKKASKVSIFRSISHNVAEDSITWLELLLNYQESSLEVVYLSRSMVPERTVFEFLGSQNMWTSFLLTINGEEESYMSLTTKGYSKQERSLAAGIAMELPRNAQFEVGGRTSNADTAFVVSQHIIILK